MKKTLEHLQSWHGCYCILLLILIIVILLGTKNKGRQPFSVWDEAIKLRASENKGRYQVVSNHSEACWIIDTVTSQLWLRTTRGGYELGTNSHPHKVEMVIGRIEKGGLLSDLVPTGSDEGLKLK